MTNRFVH